MQEKIIGGFGEIQDSEELLLKLFNDKTELINTRVLHFGTKSELEKIKNGHVSISNQFITEETELETKITKLESRIAKLENETPFTSQYIDTPTKREIAEYSRNEFIKRKCR